ncbi:MAG: hypothetical protein WEE64_10340 [Dehalococcoidia bacterium]
MANDPLRLTLHGREVKSVFQLLGHHENDMTFSLGWVLAQCPRFVRALLESVGRPSEDASNAVIRLQEHKRDAGITDIEIEVPGVVHVIVEAKRGWNLPDHSQLKTYDERLRRSTSPAKLIVVLSECSYDFAARRLSSERLTVPIKALSWKEVAPLASTARKGSGHKEKRLLDELLIYLGGLVTMQNVDSNAVYVVSLATGTPDGWGVSRIDLVEERQRYFHPAGGRGWPKEPPNYIAFRYYGALQSIHHLDDYEVVTNMHERIPEIPDGEWGEPFFLYTLGPAFAPSHRLPTGKIYPSGRVWCMLDTLFTYPTIAEARDASQARWNAAL